MALSTVIVAIFLGISFGRIDASPEFACDFEDGTMCSMNLVSAPINFTVATGQTVVDKTLGPSYDHTFNTPSGHFLYWYRSAQITRVRVDGLIDVPAFLLQPNMCLRFAYYINSISTPEKLTALGVTLIGCTKSLIWSTKIIDSNGWQIVDTRLPDTYCSALLSFFVSSNATAGVSISLDDIVIDFCSTTTTGPIGTTTGCGAVLHYSHFLLVLATGIFFLINTFL
ncbi:unnamed protein product [Rotaria sp. Silwood2]|nr:unnamed protein product [Rotaria sp. Silwood2]CAF2591703.1 unnamed protein product [Rotaria sp. Silwood2]CAF2831866.1 unnamed protein product [Rotaria sp. Silwood2]CAF4066025.1 unnamed protein product [Rotaria sp. Silwood2]CAF4199294.1 unnamed protein product [Rotaria sp. Silwood2]